MLFSIDRIDEAVIALLGQRRHAEPPGQYLALPSWLDPSLDPDSSAFRKQQMRLWSEITGRLEYQAEVNEDTPEIASLEAFRSPAFYATGDAREAGMHLLAMGHLLLRSGVTAGCSVLEYGAGFGQNALAFARLGAKVDTVDIGEGFCSAVRHQAERFDVALTPHRQHFGFNPAGEDFAYDLVLFYEAFHHCLNFKRVIPQLRRLLKPGGRVLMAGEPISRSPEPWLPYPWGIRLDWSNVAVMRHRGWMELGFREDYLVRQFADAGMSWNFFGDPNARTAQVYEFMPAFGSMELAKCGLTNLEKTGWHGAEAEGRWTSEHAELIIPARQGRLAVELFNPHPMVRDVKLALGGKTETLTLKPNDRRSVEFVQSAAEPGLSLTLDSNTAAGSPIDPRMLGIFVERVRWL